MEVNQTIETRALQSNLNNESAKRTEKSEKLNSLGLEKVEADKDNPDVKVDLSLEGIKESKTIDFFAEEENLEKLKLFANADMYGTAQANIPASTVINLLI